MSARLGVHLAKPTRILGQRLQQRLSRWGQHPVRPLILLLPWQPWRIQLPILPPPPPDQPHNQPTGHPANHTEHKNTTTKTKTSTIAPRDTGPWTVLDSPASGVVPPSPACSTAVGSMQARYRGNWQAGQSF